MAASAAVAVGHHAIQVLSTEPAGASRRVPTRQSVLSSWFLGESVVSLGQGHGHMSRPILPSLLCVRMDSSVNGGDPFSAAWQRSAVSLVDYPIAGSDLEYSGFQPTPGVGSSLGKAQNGAPAAGEVRSENGGLDISSIGLKQELVDALQKRGITSLFPIQEAVLKPATDGTDLIARARTGTGKTLAFGIPIIQSLLEQNEESRRRFRNPRVLVLAPTRELAMQVEKEFMESAPNLSTVCVYGGVSIMSQQRKLQRGVDIAVGTPGRIIDLIDRGSLALHEVRYLVLDEADQMLAVGFEEEVERILENVPTERQSMLFSATMPTWVNQLAKKYLKSPLKIDLVGDSQEKLAEGIKILSISIPASAKRSVLSDLITVYGKGGKAIVFTQTKRDADEVALSMNRMLGTEALHGDISQAQREKTLGAFRNGRFSVLVATDVAARGLDIPDVDLVIHYEIPNDPETFVHRSGRTGRAGKAGITILMHTDSQMRTVRMIERDIGCKFEAIGAPNPDDVLKASSEQARDALSKVHPDLKSVFLPTAEMLLQEQGAEALAAAIAHLSGFTQPPASRSLITHEQGWMTLLFSRNQRWGSGGGISSPRGVMGALGAIYPKAADEVGKILILDPSEGVGAVFDLPEDVAKELLSIQLGPEDSIQTISKLPRLQYDEAPRDRYGRFSSRGGRMGGGAMGRGRQQYGRSSWSETESNWGSGRREEQRSGGWRSSSGYQGNNGGYRGNNGGYQGNNGGYQRSQQTCFICGEPGHRAAACPRR